LADLKYFYGKNGARDVKVCLKALGTGEAVDQQLLEPVLKQAKQIYEESEYRSQHSATHTMCQLMHPETSSCTMGSMLYSRRCFPKTLRIYFPLNLAMLLMWKHKLLLKDPQAFLQRLVLGSLRSSAFITAFAAIAWLPPCYARNWFGKEIKSSYLLNGFLSGCTVIMEQPQSRRLELAMYCLPRALESLWNMMVKRGVVKNIPYGESIMFSVAMGGLLTLYQNEPETIPGSYKHVLIRFFGIN
jgi:hypothetical protein